MEKFNNFFSILVFTACLLGVTAISNKDVSADHHIAHPHPKYLDIWNYGVRDEDDWAYSDYWLKAPGWTRLGSKSSVTDIWGNVKSSGQSDWNWANAGAYKRAFWIRADAH